MIRMDNTLHLTCLDGPRSGGDGRPLSSAAQREGQHVAGVVGVDVHCKHRTSSMYDTQSKCIRILLCCPVLVPQMTGGAWPLGLLTLKESVRHCDA